jgi:hypothetical protein
MAMGSARWITLMAMTLAASAGCGSDDDDDSGAGPGEAGSSAQGGGSSLAGADGGNAAPQGGGDARGGTAGAAVAGSGGAGEDLQAPRGATRFVLSSSGCDLPADTSYLIPYLAIEPVTDTAQGTRVTDGMGNATVQCSVNSQGSGYAYSGTVTQGDRTFEIAGSVAPGVGGEYSGSATISYLDPEAGQLASEADGCTVTVLPDQLIGGSHIWAQFDCGTVSDPDAAQRACSAEGSFALQNCGG